MLAGKRALEALAHGMRELSRLVATTYGPGGSRVVVSKQGKLLVTMDGSSLARELTFPGIARIGVALARSASSKVDGDQGDGTSTTIILTSAIVDAALETYHPRTWDPAGIVRDIQGYLPAVRGLLATMASDPNEDVLRRVAMMSSHGDDLVAGTVTDAVLRVGENGTVLITPGDGVGIEVEYRDGVVLDTGWAAHAMGRGDGTDRAMEGPLVAVVDASLSAFGDVQGMLEEASQWPGRGLVVFCRRVDREALATLLLNDAKEVLPCLAVAFNGPDAQDRLGDIAAATNAQVVGRERGDDLHAFKSEWLGSARKITVGKHKTEVLSYPDAKDGIAARVKELLNLAGTTSSDYDRDRYQERAASLDGGLCILKVGGYTESEARERRFRVEDTLHAVKETLKEGVVPGAGRALHYVSTRPELLDSIGGQVLSRALQEPLRVLCARAGVSFGALELPRNEPWIGWCPVRQEITDFGEEPFVVDPLRVTLGALDAAVSVASEAILTEVILTRRGTSPPIPRRR
jgi:chaperonin GroEL